MAPLTHTVVRLLPLILSAMVTSSCATSIVVRPAAQPVQGIEGSSPNWPKRRVIEAYGGDRVLFSCAGVHRGPILIKLFAEKPTLTTDTRVSLAPAPDCAEGRKPRFDGRIQVGLAKGAADRLPFVQSDAEVTQVFTGDVPVARARFPAATYRFVPKGARESDRRVVPTTEWPGRLAGAKVHARTQEWWLEERIVTADDGTMDAALRYPLREKTGLYLTGKEWMVPEQAGWAWDASGRRLWVAPASLREVGITRVEPLIRIEGQGSVSIDGLDLFAAGSDALSIHVDNDVRIDSVRVSHASWNGIAIAGAKTARISRSTVTDVGRDAIFFAEVAHAEVVDNVIRNAGLLHGPGESLAAINAHRTDSATIDRNVVSRSAYIGIRFSGDARIRGNLVEDSCLYLSDCAAFYTWRRNRDDHRPASVVSGNAAIRVNGDITVKTGVNDYFGGVYLDEFTRRTAVRDNLVFDAAQGIYVHNGFDNDIESNVLVSIRALPTLDGLNPDIEAEHRRNPTERSNRWANQYIVSASDRLPVTHIRSARLATSPARVAVYGHPDEVARFVIPEGCRRESPSTLNAASRQMIAWALLRCQ